MKDLRVQVERVVRPIRASSRRKGHMREELLAHLTRLFDEELARTGDAASAMTEAVRRFGDAASLTRELQSGVPSLERWALVSIPHRVPIRRRLGESPVRYILRMNCWTFAMSVVGYALFGLLLEIVASNQRPHRADQPTSGQLILLLVGTAAIQGVIMFGEGLLCEAIRQALDRRAAARNTAERHKATWRVVGYSAASTALLAAAFVALMFLINTCMAIPFIIGAQFWWMTLTAVVLGLPLALIQSRDWNASMRRFENWDSLDLDEQRVA